MQGEKAQHEQLMQQARKDRRAEEERWANEAEAEKDRQSKERIAAQQLEAQRAAQRRPVSVIILNP